MVDDKPRLKRRRTRKKKEEQDEENHVLLCAVENMSAPVLW
jgi:hypothetical protein